MSGPGTELGKLIPGWLARQSTGCGCSNWARRMDRWGVDRCTDYREAIINRLLANRDQLPFALRAVPEPAMRIGAGLLVDRAIANARKAVDG